MCNNEKIQEGCRKPEHLTGKPEDCSPEQARECHGDSEDHSCAETSGCEHPENLLGKPGECSPDQVRRCHGDSDSHSCDSHK